MVVVSINIPMYRICARYSSVYDCCKANIKNILSFSLDSRFLPDPGLSNNSSLRKVRCNTVSGFNPISTCFLVYSIGGRPWIFLILSAIKKASSRAWSPFNLGSQ